MVVDKAVNVVNWFVVFLVGISLSGCKSQKILSRSTCGSRIISASPIATDILVHLDAKHQLLAADEHSIRRSQLKVPSIGRFQSLDVPTIASMSPSLTILDSSEDKAAAKLSELSVPTVQVAAETVTELKNAIITIGSATCNEKIASQVVASLERPQNAMRDTAVLVIVDRRSGSMADVYVAGPGSYVSEMLDSLGLSNALKTGNPYQKLSAAAIAALNPAVILDSSVTSSQDLSLLKELLSSTRAAQNGSIAGIKELEIVTPSPRLPTQRKSLASVVRAMKSYRASES